MTERIEAQRRLDAEMLARLPFAAMRRYGSLALVDDLFPAGLSDIARAGRWERARYRLERGCFIIQRADMIRRIQ